MSQVADIMKQVQEGTLTPDQGALALANLNKSKRKVNIKFGNKRNVSVKLTSQTIYPTTLYAAQWQELAEVMPDILKFIEDNKDKLAWEREAA